MRRAARVIVGPVPETQGDELSVNAPAAATVLSFDATEEFDEAGGLLSLVDSTGALRVLGYSAVDDEAATVTLIDPLPASAPAGTRVDLWDEVAGSPITEYIADILFEDQDDDARPVPAVVRASLVDRIPSILQGLAGIAVTVERDGESDTPDGDDDDDLYVVEVDGLEMRSDRAFSTAPMLVAALTANISQDSSNNVQGVTNLTVMESDRITPVVISGVQGSFFEVEQDGIYQVIATAAYATNVSGSRAVRAQFVAADGTQSPGRVVTLPGDGTSRSIVQAVQIKRLMAGDAVGLSSRQSSGAALDLLGGELGTLTGLEMVLIQP